MVYHRDLCRVLVGVCLILVISAASRPDNRPGHGFNPRQQRHNYYARSPRREAVGPMYRPIRPRTRPIYHASPGRPQGPPVHRGRLVPREPLMPTYPVRYPRSSHAKSTGYSPLLQTYINQLVGSAVTPPPVQLPAYQPAVMVPQPMLRPMSYQASVPQAMVFQSFGNLQQPIPMVGFAPVQIQPPVTYHQPITVQGFSPMVSQPVVYQQPSVVQSPVYARPPQSLVPPARLIYQAPIATPRPQIQVPRFQNSVQQGHNQGQQRGYQTQQRTNKTPQTTNQNHYQGQQGQGHRGYQTQQTSQDKQNGYQTQQTSQIKQNGYQTPPQSRPRQHRNNQPSGRHPQNKDGTGDRDRGGYGKDNEGHNIYGQRRRKKVYIPVYRPRKKKKDKVIAIMPGFYIAGGTQLFGKYKTAKSCQKACGVTPSCFAGDYNPWFNKCYLHTNITACSLLRAHKKLIHFKKIPCQVPEAPRGLITLGAQLFRGIEQKGLKSLSDCLKRCATAGTGIPLQVMNIAQQLCFGIDYDFGSHRCYFHVDNTGNRICPADGSTPLTPRDLVARAGVVNILLCPGPNT